MTSASRWRIPRRPGPTRVVAQGDAGGGANDVDMTSQIAWVGLGSNLGDSAVLLRSALRALQALPHSALLASSAFYRTPALTCEQDAAPQPDYCNAVAALRTALGATELLSKLLEIECEHGRVRAAGMRWQARQLDLDLLCLGDQVIHEPGLSVPHPELHRRNFVLEPWHDIAASLPIPGQGKVAQCRQALGCVPPPLWAR